MKKNYNKLKNVEKQKLIDEYSELERFDNKVLYKLEKVEKPKPKPMSSLKYKQTETKPKQSKQQLKTKTKTKPNTKTKRKQPTFNDYFNKCMKNKTIPKDTLPALKKELKKVIKNYNKEIEYEKTGLKGFSQNGIPKITSEKYLEEITPQLRYFLEKN